MRIDLLPERIAEKISPEPMSGCWLYTGTLWNGYGYAYDKHSQKTKPVHRVVYGLLVGAIPPGLTIDHLCRNRACVNPHHMEAVTIKVNALRGTSPTAINARKQRCVRGHEYSHRNEDQRFCRKCRCLAVKRYEERKKMKEAAAS